MKTTVKTIINLLLLVICSFIFQTSCDFNDSAEVFADLDTQIEYPTIDEEDEKKQVPR